MKEKINLNPRDTLFLADMIDTINKIGYESMQKYGYSEEEFTTRLNNLSELCKSNESLEVRVC